MAARIKGQEVSVVFVSSKGTEESVADVQSMDFQFDRDILSEGYLGQTTEQKDDIFKGVSGKIEFHVRSAGVLDLTQRINEKTKRRAPGEMFQVVATFAYPDGTRQRIVIPNTVFGTIPVSAGSRDDFVSVSYDFASEDARILPVA